MKVCAVELYNYRNYAAQSVTVSPAINIFLGRNAQGKTNILEGIWYAALGRSHRAKNDGELIRWAEKKGRLFLRLDRKSAVNTLEFRFFKGQRRQIFHNGQEIARRELIGVFNAVLFSPEDLLLIKGAPEGRRRFLNMELSQADPAYFYDLAVYTRLLNQRNALLKKLRDHGGNPAQLLPWDEQLAAAAARVVKRRQKAVADLSRLAGAIHQRLTAGEENLTVAYQLHSAVNDVADPSASWYNEMLKKAESGDIRRGNTSVGPHLDDLSLTVNCVDLRVYGSQGQQRTGVLSLKLAELEFLRAAAGEYPVLLLDDVMSELDRGRRDELLAFLTREKIQTFITATDAAYFPDVIPGAVFRVSAGTIEMAAKAEIKGEESEISAAFLSEGKDSAPLAAEGEAEGS